MGGLYKDFNEILEHCPDNIYDAVKYMEHKYASMEPDNDIDEKHALGMYVSVMSYMEFGTLYDKSQLLELHRDYSLNGDKYLTQELPKEYDRQSEALCLSSALHILHKQYPALHENAIGQAVHDKDFLGREKGIDIDEIEREIYFDVPEHLTGKDAFPEYLSQLIEEKLDGIREDVHIEEYITWEYSHLDYGEDYDYSEDEEAYVVVRALNPQVLDMVEKRLETITEKEMLDRKEEIEKQQKEKQIEKEKNNHQAKTKDYTQQRVEPYFENNVCACYKVDKMPNDFTPYMLNHDRDNYIQIFAVSTEDTHKICINKQLTDLETRNDCLPDRECEIPISGSVDIAFAEQGLEKGCQYEYKDLFNWEEFDEKLDYCMDKVIERNYEKEHEIEHERDIEIKR